jgi:hypothetical protein
MRQRLRFALLVGLVVLGACSDAPPGSDVPNLFFATYPQGDVVMSALFRGPLVILDECVLMGKAGDYALPVWPEGFAALRDESGRLTVRDADGATIAIEGQVFEMGGGYRVEFRPADKVEPRDDQLRRLAEFLGYEIPQRCLGTDVYKVWLVGETEPLAA